MLSRLFHGRLDHTSATSGELIDIAAKFVSEHDQDFEGLAVQLGGPITSDMEKYLRYAVYCHNLGMPRTLIYMTMERKLASGKVVRDPFYYSPILLSREQQKEQWIARPALMNPAYPISDLLTRMTTRRAWFSWHTEVPYEDPTIRLDEDLLHAIMGIRHDDDQFFIQTYTECYLAVALEYNPGITSQTLFEQFWSQLFDSDHDLTWVGDGLINERLNIGQAYMEGVRRI